MSRNLNFYPRNGEIPQKLDEKGISPIWYSFPSEVIVTIFYRYFVLFFDNNFNHLQVIRVGPTWPIKQTTTSNALNFEPCSVPQKYLVSCAPPARFQNPNEPNLNNKNFMHSIIDETFKYLFSLFGQGLASKRSHPNSRMIILHLFHIFLQLALLTK